MTSFSVLRLRHAYVHSYHHRGSKCRHQFLKNWSYFAKQNLFSRLIFQDMVTCMPMDVCQLLVLYSLYMPIACFINTLAGVPQTKTQNKKAKICYTFLQKRTPNHHQNIEFWRCGINGNRSCQELLDLRVGFTFFFSASLRNKFSPLTAVRKL